MSILSSRLYSGAPEKISLYKSQAIDSHCHSGSIFLKPLPPVLHTILMNQALSIHLPGVLEPFHLTYISKHPALSI